FVCDVYLSLWERAAREALPDGRQASQAARACRALGAFARIFPAATPRFALCEGRRLLLRGRTRSAMRSWRRALDAAARLRMPYDRAAAHLWLGSNLPREHPVRALHLTLAAHLSEAIAAGPMAARARGALAGAST
ncbi:MAG TPA: hypothetical protein VE987_09700, partial [Polyangiaceae bacterium]|nr:hypothetical protein [Polyangiaceae bacterium]